MTWASPTELAHPLVRELYSLARRHGKTIRSISQRSGVREDTICAWRRDNSPNVVNLEAALNALGYQLTITRRTNHA